MSIGHLDHVLIVYSSMEHVTWKSPGPWNFGSSEGQGQGWREDRIDLSCPLQELLQLIFWRDWQEVWSEDQGTQERSGLFHSWYTDPSLQGKERQAGSLVWGSRNTRKQWTLSLLVHRPEPPGQRETGRKFGLRIKEHNKAVDSFTPGTQTRASQVSHHTPCHGRECYVIHVMNVINWDKAKVVDREAQRQTRWIKEALWIRKTPMFMNRDAGSYQLSHTWDQVISRSHAPSSCKQSRRDQNVRRTSRRCH